jgi:adenylate cyclase
VTTLDAIRRCLEGVVPSVIATCAVDGTPNVAVLSQVHYVDAGHVALSWQFFNKTRENILENPRATVLVIDPATAAQYRLHLEYLRTETEGPLFESMKAKLAGIASHTGMSRVFRLLGSDVYRVLRLERVPGEVAPEPPAVRQRLPAVRRVTASLGAGADLSALLDGVLDGLRLHLGIDHAMLMMHDARRACLYTVASIGYETSGVGSEVQMGEGIIGVVARERTPIRIGYAAHEYLYSRATRRGFANGDNAGALETEIPFPGLPDSRSQAAVPVMAGDNLLGVLFVESGEELRFTYEDEDALAVVANALALAIERLSLSGDSPARAPARRIDAVRTGGAELVVRHYASDHGVFVDDEYLIKGVAGAILWTLLRERARSGRDTFTNRELRRHPDLPLPDITDNLEARLILLRRRLEERGGAISIEKAGRGRFRLVVNRPVRLVEASGR